MYEIYIRNASEYICVTNCRYANVSDVQIHTEIHLCIVRIYIYIRVSTSCAYTYTRERRTSPSSLASPRFSSSCTSTPSFFCLALAPSRYSRRITENENRGQREPLQQPHFYSFPRALSSFYRVSNRVSRSFSKISPLTYNRMDYFDSIYIYIYKTSVKLNSFVDSRRRRRRSGEVIDAV